jgi:hypothetical protein
MTMGAVSETIILRGIEVELTSAAGQEFLLGATRAAEGLVDDSELAEKWELSLEELKTLANNKAVGRAIKELRARRVNSGAAARESAAQIFVRSPKAMGEILDSSHTSPRVKIEASRELRATAIGTGDDNRPAETERFVIRIDLTAGGGEVLDFNKAIKIDADDVAPNEQPKLPTRPKLTVLSNDGLETDE